MNPQPIPRDAHPGRENLFHVGLFGRPNVGKSALFNRLAGQAVSIVSEYEGTTNDPVRKRVELPGAGPVMLIDTPGIGDGSALEAAREAQIRQTAYQVDLALLLCSHSTWGGPELALLQLLRRAGTPLLIVHTREDAAGMTAQMLQRVRGQVGVDPLCVSIATDQGVPDLLDAIARRRLRYAQPPNLFEGVLGAGQAVLLVTPIDSAAPKGRLILPQVQAIRAALDLHAVALVVQEAELPHTLRKLAAPPDLVVTDSQLFGSIDRLLSPQIPLTSFSILLARQKGDFQRMLAGIDALETLSPEAKILMVESCAHHATCEDIGRVKIPQWMRNRFGTQLTFDYAQGASLLPAGLAQYDLAILCGGCMVTPRQLRGTTAQLLEAGIPITNYGMTIAYLHGIFHRATAMFR